MEHLLFKSFLPFRIFSAISIESRSFLLVRAFLENSEKNWVYLAIFERPNTLLGNYKTDKYCEFYPKNLTRHTEVDGS